MTVQTQTETSVMEDRLQALIKANSEENRAKIALEYKKQGWKVIGVVNSHVPEEILYAAGIFPYRVSGTWREDMSLASYWRPANYCRFSGHVLQRVLEGGLDFLDGMVFTYWCDNIRRVWDVLEYTKFKPFNYMLYLPHKDTEMARQQFALGLERLADAVRKFSRVRVDSKNLSDAIRVYNDWRDAMARLYELRKRDVPPLTGAEYLGVTTASYVMTKDKHTEELEALMPYLETRKAPLQSYKPRLLVAGEALDNPAYIELIESTGCLVAMDDLEGGSRYWANGKVTAGENSDLKSLLRAVADGYLSRPQGARSFEWDKYLNWLKELVKEYSIDGVINFPQADCQWHLIARPYLEETLKASGIRVATLVREYRLANVGPLRTRIGAFVETL